MTTKPPVIKARITVPSARALWIAAQFMAGDFSVVKISPPYPTRNDQNQSNVYFDIVIDDNGKI